MSERASETIGRRRRTRRLIDALGRWSGTGVIAGAVLGFLISGGLYDGLVIVLGGVVGMVVAALAFAVVRLFRHRS